MQELTLKEIQLISLEILKDVHSFCIKENITYSLAYGTLIGAVRHCGFIPWDNDIDIIMPRPEYEKFIHSYKSDKYELAYLGCTKYDCLITYARVFDTKKTVAKNYNWIKSEVGIWIDIFPLDGVSNNTFSFIEMYNSYKKIWDNLIVTKVQFESIFNKKHISEKLRLLIRKCRTLNGLGGHKRYKQYNNLIQAIPFGTTDFCSQLTVMDNGPVEHIPISVFNKTKLMKFENTEFYVIKNFDLVLRSIYGDYMQMPPPNQQVPHQEFIKFYWK